MDLTILIALLVCIVGVVVFAVASNPNVKEMGRAMMWCGLLVTLFRVGGAHVRIGG